jgi:hypothetical protein
VEGCGEVVAMVKKYQHVGLRREWSSSEQSRLLLLVEGKSTMLIGTRWEEGTRLPLGCWTFPSLASPSSRT